MSESCFRWLGFLGEVRLLDKYKRIIISLGILFSNLGLVRFRFRFPVRFYTNSKEIKITRDQSYFKRKIELKLAVWLCPAAGYFAQSWWAPWLETGGSVPGKACCWAHVLLQVPVKSWTDIVLARFLSWVRPLATSQDSICECQWVRKTLHQRALEELHPLRPWFSLFISLGGRLWACLYLIHLQDNRSCYRVTNLNPHQF